MMEDVYMTVSRYDNWFTECEFCGVQNRNNYCVKAGNRFRDYCPDCFMLEWWSSSKQVVIHEA